MTRDAGGDGRTVRRTDERLGVAKCARHHVRAFVCVCVCACVCVCVFVVARVCVVVVVIVFVFVCVVVCVCLCVALKLKRTQKASVGSQKPEHVKYQEVVRVETKALRIMARAR